MPSKHAAFSHLPFRPKTIHAMKESKQCCKNVYDHSLRFPHPHPCKRAGKVERGGEWYCGTHDPVEKKKKYDARVAKWKMESEMRSAHYDKTASLFALGTLVKSGASDSTIAEAVRKIFTP